MSRNDISHGHQFRTLMSASMHPSSGGVSLAIWTYSFSLSWVRGKKGAGVLHACTGGWDLQA